MNKPTHRDLYDELLIDRECDLRDNPTLRYCSEPLDLWCSEGGTGHGYDDDDYSWEEDHDYDLHALDSEYDCYNTDTCDCERCRDNPESEFNDQFSTGDARFTAAGRLALEIAEMLESQLQ